MFEYEKRIRGDISFAAYLYSMFTHKRKLSNSLTGDLLNTYMRGILR
jgi:hypothetical protein